jgi:hypothetical protein
VVFAPVQIDIRDIDSHLLISEQLVVLMSETLRMSGHRHIKTKPTIGFMTDFYKSITGFWRHNFRKLSSVILG